MKKTKNIITIVIIVISLALILVISNILLDTTGVINQGDFRVNDALIKSFVNVEEKANTTAENAKDLSGLKLNLSQKNTLSMLITKDSEYSKMYINNISFKTPLKTSGVFLSQSGYDSIYEINSNLKEVNIYPSEKDNQYFVELNINNANFLSDASIPENVKVVTYDGTILKLFNIGFKDIKFELKFDFNIVDKSGKNNICKIKLNLPDEKLLNEGISVVRQNPSDYVFSIKE